MEASQRISIGICSAMIGCVVVFLMPIIVTIVGTLVNRVVVSGPESRGFLTLYLLIATSIQLPTAAALGALAYALNHGTVKTVKILFVLSILMMTISGTYFAKWFIGFPYIKYLPAIFYLLVLSPLLLQGTLAFTDLHRNPFYVLPPSDCHPERSEEPSPERSRMGPGQRTKYLTR